MKRYNGGVFLLGSCRSCLQLHGNEVLPKGSGALDCPSNAALRVKEWMGDSVATFIPNNSRNYRDTVFLSVTDEESLLEPVDLEQPQRAMNPGKGGHPGTKQCEAP